MTASAGERVQAAAGNVESERGRGEIGRGRQPHPLGEVAKRLLAREHCDLDVFGSTLHHFEQSAQRELQCAYRCVSVRALLF